MNMFEMSDDSQGNFANTSTYTVDELPPPPTTTYVANKPSAFSLLLDNPETWEAAAEGLFGNSNTSGKQAVKLPGQRGGSSKYRGVSWYKTARKWVAQISIDGKPTFLGYFESEEDAARKFDEHASKYGRKLNWPQETLVESHHHTTFPMPSNFTNRDIPRDSYLPAAPSSMTYVSDPGCSSSASSATSSEASSPQHADDSHDDTEKESLDNGMSAALQGLSASKKWRASSQFKGVSWSRAAHKWKAEIYLDGRSNYLGHFNNEEEAARKYDEVAVGLNRTLNFPTQHLGVNRVPAALRSVPSLSKVSTGSASSTDLEATLSQQPTRSNFVGVSWYQNSQKWRAQITLNGTPKYLGSFDSEIEAARKYDEFAKIYGKPVNLPENASEERAAKTAMPDPQREYIDRGPSRYVGVRWHRANQKWTSYIRVAGKQMALGAYEDEETAARKYDEYAARHGRPLNFPLEVSPKLATNAYIGSMKRSGDSEDGEVSNVIAQATKRNKTKGAVVSSVSTTSPFNRGVSLGNGDIVLFMLEHTWWPCEVGRNLAHFGNSVNSLHEDEIASLKAHTGSIAKICTREGESPRFYALSDTDELRFMTSADRAPRCATLALKEAFVEARHSILTNPTMNHSINSQQRARGSRWEDIAANVGDFGGDGNGDDDDINTQDEDKNHVALSLLADASAGGRQTSLSEAAELMAAMKRQPEMTISNTAIYHEDTLAFEAPSTRSLNEAVIQDAQEHGAALKQFTAI